MVLLETMSFSHSEKAGTTVGLETGSLSKVEKREPQPGFSLPGSLWLVPLVIESSCRSADFGNLEL